MKDTFTPLGLLDTSREQAVQIAASNDIEAPRPERHIAAIGFVAHEGSCIGATRSLHLTRQPPRKPR